MDISYLDLDGAIVVEFHGLDSMPKPEDPVFYLDPIYDNPAFNKVGKRWIGQFCNHNAVSEYFTWLLHDQVFAALWDLAESKKEYPFTADFMRMHTCISCTLLRDEKGWQQPIHNDNRTYVMAGVFHLQDSQGGGTTIYGAQGNERIGRPTAIYHAPSEESSGAAWVNNNHSWHSIGPTPSERLFYLLHVHWRLG